jgi:peptidyl-prolyl cis-trans isomerase B (cyclophilin B)
MTSPASFIRFGSRARGANVVAGLSGVARAARISLALAAATAILASQAHAQPTPASAATAPAASDATPASSDARTLTPLVPDRLYHGVNRPIRVTLRTPTLESSERLRVVLLDARGVRIGEASRDVTTSAQPRGQSDALTLDLAALLPDLWVKPLRNAAYVQLEAVKQTDAPASDPVPAISSSPQASRRIGAPLVIEPLRSPLRAELDERVPGAPRVHFPKPAQAEVVAFTGYRVYIDERVHLLTDAGAVPIRVRLRPDCAPNTAWNFRVLAAGGFYDDVIFHRVVPVGRVAGRGFVIQGGDPTGTGEGTPGYELPFEPSTLTHDFGVVSMARDKGPNTGGAQFFICLSREETARLDGLYVSFAQIEGDNSARIVRAIAAGPLLPGDADRPEKPFRITRVWLEPAPPLNESPAPTPVPTR